MYLSNLWPSCALRAVFILNLQYRDEGVTVDMWRSGNALRPYFHDVRMVVYNKAMFPDLHGFNIVDREALSFVHFPIRDCGITDDERVLELSRTLVKAISEGEVIYLHCWGGHGRTGTLVCIMLHLMYSVCQYSMKTLNVVLFLGQKNHISFAYVPFSWILWRRCRGAS